MRGRLLVEVNDLPLTEVADLPGGGLLIGALARMSDVARPAGVVARFPVIWQALLAGASAQLRNMASMGGNLCQRARCSYFRDATSPCNKREPGTGCAAMDGFHRGHAILGTSGTCIATHPSDVAVALDAVVHTRGPGGERAIGIDDFFLLPGDTSEREHPLKHGELITAIEVPAAPIARGSVYLKFRDRESYGFALVSAAAAVDVADGTIVGVRVALGGVGTRPWRARRAEHGMLGRSATAASFADAADERVQGRARAAGDCPGPDDTHESRRAMGGAIGQEVSRVDGPARVAGAARYFGEIALAAGTGSTATTPLILGPMPAFALPGRGHGRVLVERLARLPAHRAMDRPDRHRPGRRGPRSRPPSRARLSSSGPRSAECFQADPGPGVPVTFPATLALAGAVFTAMLQLPLVCERWPLSGLELRWSGLVALALSWAAGTGTYYLLVNLGSVPAAHRAAAGLRNPDGPIAGPDFGSALIAVGVWQTLLFIALRGWPVNTITRRPLRLFAGIGLVIGLGALVYLVLRNIAHWPPAAIGAACGCVISAALVVAMLFRAGPPPGYLPLPAGP